MFRYECDICGTECTPVTTRRMENIVGYFGLELVILRGERPVGDTHLCENCILKMFWNMLEKVKGSPLKKIKDDLLDKQVTYEKLVNEAKIRSEVLNDSRKELASLERILKIREEKLQEREMEFERIRSEVVQVKPDIEERKIKELVRLAEQRGYQRAVDEREYPEYGDAISTTSYFRTKGF